MINEDDRDTLKDTLDERLEQIEKYNYWLVFADEPDEDNMNEVHHIIGTVGFPSDDDIADFTEEVRTDEEFGLGDLVDSLIIQVVSKEDGLPIARSLLQD